MTSRKKIGKRQVDRTHVARAHAATIQVFRDTDRQDMSRKNTDSVGGGEISSYRYYTYDIHMIVY